METALLRAHFCHRVFLFGLDPRLGEFLRRAGGKRRVNADLNRQHILEFLLGHLRHQIDDGILRHPHVAVDVG